MSPTSQLILRWGPALLLFGFSAAHAGPIVFDNGRVNVVNNDLQNSVVITDSVDGKATTVRATDGGIIASAQLFKRSRLILESGSEIDGGALISNDHSRVVVDGGRGDRFFARGHSDFTILNGSFVAEDNSVEDNATFSMLGGGAEDISVNGNATALIAGARTIEGLNFGGTSRGTILDVGQIWQRFNVGHSSEVSIFGGNIVPDSIDVAGQLSIFGGNVAPSTDPSHGGLRASGAGTVEIFGYGFNFDFGPIALDSGVLTGWLLDGTSLDLNFKRVDPTAKIILRRLPLAQVPAPTPIGLVVSGLVILLVVRHLRPTSAPASAAF